MGDILQEGTGVPEAVTAFFDRPRQHKQEAFHDALLAVRTPPCFGLGERPY